ncbi:MAG: phosphoribosyl-AMP cyclohydrolase [Pseudohongiellaceae bacterium]|jgi:phosphoribosyl-AMP cyclohydrolase|nr:phosphoribosyl-AMP cyclohydrolase [Pseudomonadota bacterium]NBQ73229.1 phosphoribosyl-AMP cyclohydrolase [Gammaproteobacteria bacterium]
MISYLDQVAWNEQGLAPAIAVDATSDKLLMQAWVNREALATAVAEKRAVYWSRSRGKLWRKGEESGNVQQLIEIRLDCDGDAICYRVEQIGGIACHTGRAHCFYQRLENEAWVTTDEVLVEPEQLYRT